MRTVIKTIFVLSLLVSANAYAIKETSGAMPGYAGDDASVASQDPEPLEPACDYNYLIGKPSSAIEPQTFEGRFVRYINEYDPVTEDYSPNRITVILDSQDTIVRIGCQ